MSGPEERRAHPSRTARERAIARRMATQRGSWRTFWIAAIALCGLIVVLLATLLWRRTDQTLATIEQEDPRQQRATAVIATRVPATARPIATLPPAPTPAPTARAVVDMPLPEALRQPLTILLVGVDKRPNPDEGVRSDTLILVHLDPQNRWASMLSIPRDSMVHIPNLGLAKINAAYSHGYSHAEAIYGVGTTPDEGGGALVAETLEQFLQIRVDYIAQIDFQGFERLVDTVGGLIIDVPAPLLDGEYPTENYGYQRIYIPAGLQVMDGRTALIYARTRHASTDFERSKRQQQVLRALLKQVRDRGLFENAALLPEWAKVLQENIRTTLPIRDFSVINGLALLARDLDSDRIVQLSINPNDVAIDLEDGSDIYWNEADLAALVERWQAGPAEAAQAP